MPNSGTVTAGSAALASQYNNLRDDVLNTSTGHTHTGASENGAKVAATGISSGTAANGAVLTADGSGASAFLAAAASGGILKYEEFTSSGSFVIPANASSSAVIVLEVLGAGAGGAGGPRVTSGSEAYNTDGGAGGPYGLFTVLASNYGTAGGTVTVTIGAGGAGGTARTTNGSQTIGARGGLTSFGASNFVSTLGHPAGFPFIYGTSAAPYIANATFGANNVASGSALAVVEDVGNFDWAWLIGGCGQPQGNTTGYRSGSDSGLVGAGGASGAGISATPTASAGGNGGKRYGVAQGEVNLGENSRYLTFGNGAAGGTAGGGAGGTATGSGGGGGGSSTTGAGGAGGAGDFGCGGGGGGASLSPNASGAGGAGGGARVRVWVIG
jgi:hypothetical protein